MNPLASDREREALEPLSFDIEEDARRHSILPCEIIPLYVNLIPLYSLPGASLESLICQGYFGTSLDNALAVWDYFICHHSSNFDRRMRYP